MASRENLGSYFSIACKIPASENSITCFENCEMHAVKVVINAIKQRNGEYNGSNNGNSLYEATGNKCATL